MARIFNIIIKLRYLIMLTVISIVMFLGYRAKDIVMDFSTRSLFISDDPTIDFLGKHRRIFGDDDNTVLIVLKSDNIFTPSFLAMLDTMVTDIKKIRIKRPPLKVDTDKREREFKGYGKNKDSDIAKIVDENIETQKKENKNDDDEEEIIDDDDDFFSDDNKDKDVVKSIFESKVGELVNPIERVISIVNVKNIYGKIDDDGINSIYVSPFISRSDLNKFSKTDMKPLNELKKKMLKHHLYKGQLISKDGKTTAIAVKLNDIFILEPERTPIINKIEKIYKDYQKNNPKIVKNLNVKIAIVGVPISQREYSRFISKDLFFFFGLSAIVMGIILLFIFRKVHGVVLPLTIVSFAAIATFGIMELTNESLNIVNNIIPTLILVIGLSDTIHLIHRYHREVNVNNKDKKTAIIDTFVDLFKACFITSFTTAIGFFSLLTAKIDIIERLGVYSGIGIILSFIFIMLLLPGILFLLPIPKFTKGDKSLENKKEKSLISTGFLDAINQINAKKPFLVIASFVTIVLISIFFITKINVNTRMLEEMKSTNQVYKDTKFSEKNLTGVLPIEINIATKDKKHKNGVLKSNVLEAMDKFKSYIRKSEPEIGTVSMISDYIKESYWAANGSKEKFYKIPQDSDGVKANDLILSYLDRLKDSEDGKNDISHLVSDDGNTARISLAQNDVGLKVFFKTVKRFRTQIKKLFPPSVKVEITGGNYVAYRALSHIIEDMLTSLAVAFIFITIVMIIMLKSVKIGLLSMLPNTLPIIVTMGVMGVSGIVVRTSTVLIFSIALGIAVDDSIHFLTRYKVESLLTDSNEIAIRNTMLGTGRAIIFTSVLIILGVSPLIFSEFVAIIHYSILTSVTMLTALLADIFLLPVLLHLVNPLKLKK